MPTARDACPRKHFDELTDDERILLGARARGLMTSTARRLGIHHSSVAKVFRGERNSTAVRRALLTELRGRGLLDEQNRLTAPL